MLKLAALDEDDLQVIAAHVQDSLVRVGDITFDAPHSRLMLEMNRFAWETKRGLFRPKYERRRAVLHFDRVSNLKRNRIAQDRPDDVVSLLTIHFSASVKPAGTVELVFADHAALQFDVEAIEVRLTDLGSAWEAGLSPVHG